MSVLRDLCDTARELARAFRAHRSPTEICAIAAMSLLQERGNWRDGGISAAPPVVAAAPLLIAIELEVVQTGLQVRRSGLGSGARVTVTNIPEDVAAPGSMRFSAAIVIQQLDADTVELDVECGERRAALSLVYGERVETGVETPSGHMIALAAFRA